MNTPHAIAPALRVRGLQVTRGAHTVLHGVNLEINAGDTLVVRVKGDCREYVLNIYTKSRRMAFSYRAPLPTKRDEWTEVSVPLDEFIPTSFGNRVQGMGPVEPDQINSLGFMLSDKKPGPFKLEVDWVKITPADKDVDPVENH